MNQYVPFLKLKINEVGALCELDKDIKSLIIPFFDLPRKKQGMSSDDFTKLVNKSVRSIEKNLKGFSSFYLDNFDIEDSIKVDGMDNYQFVIDSFSNQNFTPVVGLDRTVSRNKIVFESKRAGKIRSNNVAIRLQSEDVEEFSLIKDELLDLLAAGAGLFETWTLIIDNRLCTEVDCEKRISQILNFIPACLLVIPFHQIVITGSSIPASIGDVISTNTEGSYERRELGIVGAVFQSIDDDRLVLGDYTVVSPLYSDIDIPPEALRNVTAPKITYSYDKCHYFFRGGQLSSHPRGNLQYNDLAARLTAMGFYRQSAYSFGDRYLSEKANGGGKGVTPSSILKPSINAHITYMFRDFHF